MNKALLYGGGLTLVGIGALCVILGVHAVEVAVAVIRED